MNRKREPRVAQNLCEAKPYRATAEASDSNLATWLSPAPNALTTLIPAMFSCSTAAMAPVLA